MPQWMPFTAQGTVATWWYTSTTSLVQHVLLLVPSVVARVNFLPLLYGSVFVDEIVLVVGIWLLARRFLDSSLAVAFVAATTLGSAVWMDQPWWNFHFY